MTHFDYLEPKDLAEAIDLLATYAPDAALLAGGTDLIVAHLHHLEIPETIIGITSIPSLKDIRFDSNQVCIGSTATMHQLAISEIVNRYCKMLAESSALVGSRQIRNLATLGGNICNAVPSADTAPPLLASEAEVVIEGPDGTRKEAICDFFVDVRETVLEPDEIVVEFRIPEQPPRTGNAYLRHSPRKALDLAVVGVAASITLNENLIIERSRIALGAVAPTPFRAFEAEELLTGNDISDALLDEVAVLAEKASKPISDVRGSADYRQSMIRELTKRSIAIALERAMSEI